MIKSVYFAAKSIGITAKSVYFAAKSIDFMAGKRHLQARQSVCLRHKSFDLIGLGKEPPKRQQNDFTTKIRRTRRKR